MTPSMATTSTATNEGAISTDEVKLSTSEGYDDEQIRLMEEVCIVIDENDHPIRPGTKKECLPFHGSSDDRPFDE
jgi:isopentenyl-diphosphate delta-isomerase